MAIVPPTVGYQHVVSSGHELATFAAYEVLEQGGNAIDAGVAACLALGVVYSDQVSVAGVAPMIVRLANGQTHTVAGVGGWPRALDVNGFITRHQGAIPMGVRRTVVPAAPDVFVQVLRRWGTMRFADVARRAQQYAAQGFARHPVMVDYTRQYAECYRQFDDNAAIWMPGGEVPAVASHLVQSDLASTLQYLCDEDRACATRAQGLDAVWNAFYVGDIAQQILAHQRAHDGLLGAADMAEFRAQILPALMRTYNFGGEQVKVHTCGAWSQGPFTHEALAMLQHLDLEKMGYGSEAYFHTLAETFKLTLADREAYLGDPDFVDVPLAQLTSASYAAERAALIDATAAPGMPMPGRAGDVEPYLSPVISRTEPERLPADTSIVAVVDRFGNALCATPSDTSWDTPVVPGTGLAVSSRGHQSWAVHGHPSSLAPGKRPRLTPNPCLLECEGQWLMPFGTPGGDQQIQANVQTIVSHLRFGMPLQCAIEAPRLITHSHPDSFAPHHASPGRLTIEGRVDLGTTEGLAARGHRVERLPEWTHAVAGICAVKKHMGTGAIEGGADPRRMSRALGR